MNKRIVNSIVTVGILFLLSFSMGYGQGDNTPDPMVNLGCLAEAIVTGSVPDTLSGGKLPGDILWDPATNDYKQASSWHEYGLGYQVIFPGSVTKENPVWWQVEWPTAKNINYITVTGTYGNQPQPTTGWSIQIDVDGTWQDLAKAHDGWDADSLRGTGGWVHDGLMELRLMEPVVTTKLRFCAYANPDSVADGVETFADSLWSFSWTGLKKAATAPNACLIQYLDFTGETASNTRKDAMVNLALLHEAVVSGSYANGDIQNLRGQPADMLWDPQTGDFNYINTSWGEYGMPYQYDAGYVEYDDPFYWMVEWPVPKNVSYFTWGGCYGNQPQPFTPWAVEYWDGAAWVELAAGEGSERFGPPLLDSKGDAYDYPGIGVDSTTNSTWQSEVPIQTTKLRLAVWSDGIDPLFSFHIRGRGGQTDNWDETDWIRYYEPVGYKGSLGGSEVLAGADPIPSTFKALLVQYRDPVISSVESDDFAKPSEFSLGQNYPNPFNPQTNIKFNLRESDQVRLTVYNIQGQEVAVLVDEKMASGNHQVTFDAHSLSSGVYYYRLDTGQGVLTKKMMVIK